MVDLTLNGKDYQCATCKEELTIGQYQRIIGEWGIEEPDLLKRDNLKLFNILTGANFGSSSLSIEHEQIVFDHISWVFSEQFTFSQDVPKVLKIGDKDLELPKKIGGCSIGQNIILKQLIDQSKYLQEVISSAVAVYLMPQYYGVKFSAEKAKELEAEVIKMPAYLVYPIGFFLLNRVNQNGNPFTRHRHQILHSLKQNLNAMLPTWLRLRNLRGMNT